LKFIGTFGFKSGRDIDKFQGVNFRAGVTGSPIVLDHSLSTMEVALYGTLDVESHTIFVGKIVASEKIKDGEPLTYRYYKEVKGGRPSKYAPTFNDWSLLEKMEAKKA
jgi:flavin reductase (DIM6/NTAB) family NADH-FMN oxidoreductase RutF